MPVRHSVLAPCLIASLSTCTAGQDESFPGLADAAGTQPGELGEVVQDLGNKLWIVFQDKRNRYWFGSDGQGVYRVEGKKVVRYTTKDGLANDHVRQILEDEAGNIYVNTNGGISKFDGRRFSTLVPIEGRTSEWKLEPGDLWFKGGKGPYRYDGQSLFQLEFPKHTLEDEFNSKFPSVPYSPYGIYTVYEDSQGSIWFGTACFGACRYDGHSFTWVSEPELTELEDGPSFGIRGLVEGSDGRFWLSNTLYRYDVYPVDPAQEKPAIPYRRQQGIGDPGPYDPDHYSYFVSGLRDDQGALWLATYGAGVWRYDGERLTHYPVVEDGKTVLLYSIHADHQGVLWLGATESGAYRFNGQAFERFKP